eukprot:5041282-Pleurochrysis_carterae.AAC.7
MSTRLFYALSRRNGHVAVRLLRALLASAGKPSPRSKVDTGDVQAHVTMWGEPLSQNGRDRPLLSHET